VDDPHLPLRETPLKRPGPVPVTPDDLYRSPNALAPYYSRFRVAERLLLTGHSHQAWPDCSRSGQIAAWDDAAELVDDKWPRAFARAEQVRRAWRSLLDDPDGEIALGANTHDLVVRFLSALPLRRRPVLVTTSGEFHTIRRQLDRLAEEGLEIRKVAAEPVDDLVARLLQAADECTAAVLVSAVLFRNAHIVPHLGELAAGCEQLGVELLVDAYHALNVVPFSLQRQRLQRAFLVGGGYKYCQLGEGNCFLRFPADCAARPVVTGWFSEFTALAEEHSGTVAYGAGPARFAGATYDPTAHYRATEVFGFFTRMALTPELLRKVSRHQVGLLAERFDALDLDPAVVRRDRAVPLEQIGGFLALRSSRAADLCRLLRQRGVLTDHRDDVLRFGPAPYLSDEQLGAAVAALAKVAREIRP